MVVDLILRVAVIAISYFVAAWAAAITLFFTLGGRITSAMRSADTITDADAAFDAFDRALNVASFILKFVGSFTLNAVLAVSLGAIVVGEIFRFRSWVYYVLAGGMAMGAAAAVQGLDLKVIDFWVPGAVVSLVAAGFVGGGVYWLFAGRRAGF